MEIVMFTANQKRNNSLFLLCYNKNVFCLNKTMMENRGNGLKFVRNNVNEYNLLLEFNSGNAQMIINHGMKKNNLENKINGCLAILNF